MSLIVTSSPTIPYLTLSKWRVPSGIIQNKLYIDVKYDIWLHFDQKIIDWISHSYISATLAEKPWLVNE